MLQEDRRESIRIDDDRKGEPVDAVHGMTPIERYLQVFRAIGDSVLLTDLAGRIVDCNPAAETTLGHPREVLVGSAIDTYLHQGGIPDRHAAVGETLVAGGRWTDDVPYFRADGTVGVSATTVVGICADDGTLAGTAIIGRDVTDERRLATQLAQAEERWRLTLDGAPNGVALVEIDGHFLRVNKALCHIVGYDEADLLQLTFQDLTHPDDLDPDLTLLAKLTMGEIDSYTLEKRYLHADGHAVWIKLSVGLIIDPTTWEPLHYVSQMEDITDRIGAENASRRVFERQAAVVAAQLAIADLELTPGTVMQEICNHAKQLTDADGAVIELREGDHMIFRAVTAELDTFLGTSLPVTGSLSGLALTEDRTMVCHDTAADPRVDAEACRRIGVGSMIVVPLRRAGSTIGVLNVLSARPDRFSDDDRSTLELIAAPFGTAMSNAWQLQATSEQALTDPLTNLANRTYALHELDRVLHRQIRRGGHTAVVFIDLDGFKQVNDRHGHAAGDETLVTVSTKLREAVRTTDTPARFGGDEFVIICEGLVDPGDVQHLADRLCDSLPGTYPVHNGSVLVGASIGIAVADRPVAAHRLLRAADEAMYEAKQAGGNRHTTRHLH